MSGTNLRFVEPMESRRLLSASIDADGVLVVSASSSKDVIIISRSADDSGEIVVKVNKEVEDFAIADITTGIRVSALGGKDKVAVDETNGAITLNVTMYGGNGKDDLHGGSGDDKIDGGTGKDRIFGRAGDDRLIGWSGNDYLQGDAGSDYITGNAGVDTILGGDGDDDVNGGGSRDVVTGGAGNDDFGADDGESERTDLGADDDGGNARLDLPT